MSNYRQVQPDTDQSNLGRLPDFLIIGAMKSGTTTFYEDLSQHPELFLPPKKEPNVLAHATNPSSAASMYGTHFGGAPEGKLCGEASTIYSMFPYRPDVSELALKTLGPELRLIYVMRDPIDRIFSHLAHDFMNGRLDSTDFDEIVRTSPQYLQVSDYPAQLAVWANRFGRQQIHCVSFERFIGSRESVIDETLAFLGVKHLGDRRLEEKVKNKREDLVAPRHPLISRALNSHFYTFVARRVVPETLRTRLKAILTTQRNVPEIRLSTSTLSWLADQLGPRMDRLEAEYGIRIEINSRV